jgi:hypothetical protein
MYFGHEEPRAAITFLGGFSTAAGVALAWNWECRFDVRQKVTIGRGWEWTSTGPHHQMASKGWLPSKIVAELIELEAEYIRQMMAASRVQSE